MHALMAFEDARVEAGDYEAHPISTSAFVDELTEKQGYRKSVGLRGKTRSSMLQNEILSYWKMRQEKA